MTVGPWIDRAYVGILPDFSRFANELHRGISRSLNDLQRDADKAADDIDRRFERLGRDISHHLDQDDAFDGLPDQADRAGEESGRRFGSHFSSEVESTEVKVKPDVDDSGIRRARSSTRGLTAELRSAGLTVNALRPLGRIGLAAGIVAAVPAAFSLASALSSVAGAAAVIPGALAAVGQSVATVGLGFLGIADAVKALNDQQSEAAKTAASTASEQTAAADRVRSAQEQVRSSVLALQRAREQAAEGARNAAERVREAELRLADSQRDARRAQEDLNQARAEARQRLADLRLELTRATLSEEDAVLSLREARQRLNEVRLDPRADALDRERAALSVRMADQALRETRARNKTLREDAAAARRAGVEGSAEVIRARQGVADAENNVAEATHEMRIAQQEARRAAVEGNRAVAEAARDLKLAQQDAARAAVATGVATSAAADKARQAMDNLSPAGQRFARFLFSLRDEFQRLRDVAQTGLLPGVEAGIRSLLPLLPMLERNLAATARVMGDLAAAAGDRLARRQADLKLILDTNTLAMKDFGAAGLDLIDVFVDLGVTARPLIRWVGELARGWAENVRETIATARANGNLTRFFDHTRTTLEHVLNIVGNLTGIITDLGLLAFPSGQGLLGSLDTVLEKLHDFTTQLREGRGVGGAIRAWIGSIADAVKDGNWGKVAENVRSGLVGAVKTAAENSSSAVIDGLATGLQEGNWKPLGDALGRRLVELPLAVTDALRRIEWRDVGHQAALILVPFALGLAGGLMDGLIQAFREDFWATLIDIAMLIPLGRAAGILGRAVPALLRVPFLGGFLRVFEGAGKLLEAPIRGFVRRFGDDIIEGISRVFPGVGRALERGLGRGGMLDHLRLLAWEWRDAGLRLIGRLAGGIAEQFALVTRNVGQVIVRLTRPFVSSGRWLVREGTELVAGLLRGLRSLWGLVSSNITLTISRLLNPFRGIGRWLLREGGDLLRGLLTGLRGLWGTVSSAIRSTISLLLNPFRGIGRWLLREGGDLLRGLSSGIRNLWGSLSDTIRLTIVRLTSPFARAGRWLFESGRQVLQGLLVGVRKRISEIGGLGSWFKSNLVDPIINAVKHFFRLGSPSRVFADIGTNLVAGLFQGVVRANPVKAITAIFGGMPEALRAIVGKGLISLTSLPQSILGKIFGFLGGMVGGTSGSWHRAIDELIQDHVAYRIISTFRRGAVTHASGRQSYHALNRAVDLVGPDMMSIFNALTDTHPTELIYSRAPYYFARGAWKPIGQLDPVTYADHLGHVHAAYQQGAWEHLQDEMAFIHRGEMTVPASFASGLRSAMAGGGESTADAIREQTVGFIDGLVEQTTRSLNGEKGQTDRLIGWLWRVERQLDRQTDRVVHWLWRVAGGVGTGPLRRFHSGGTLPEDIWGRGRSGRAYSFQEGERLTSAARSRQATVVNIQSGAVQISVQGPVAPAMLPQITSSVQDGLQAVLRELRTGTAA